MAALKFKETLKMLEDKGLKLSKRTFEYYQSLGLLPKPEKKVGEKGRGLYGYYDSGTILKAVGFIFTLREKGVPLDEIREEAKKAVMNQYLNHLKKWGFSDYSLPEMRSSHKLFAEQVGKMLPGGRSEDISGFMSAELVEGNQGLDKEERAFFETDLISKAKWWETDKIEAMALAHIGNKAKSIFERIVLTELFIRNITGFLKIDFNTTNKILKTVEDRLRDIYILINKLNSRLSEISGEILIKKSGPYWKPLSERFEATTVTRKG